MAKKLNPSLLLGSADTLSLIWPFQVPLRGRKDTFKRTKYKNYSVLWPGEGACELVLFKMRLLMTQALAAQRRPAPSSGVQGMPRDGLGGDAKGEVVEL